MTISDNLENLDGTLQKAVEFITGLSAEELDALGGFPDERPLAITLHTTPLATPMTQPQWAVNQTVHDSHTHAGNHVVSFHVNMDRLLPDMMVMLDELEYAYPGFRAFRHANPVTTLPIILNKLDITANMLTNTDFPTPLGVDFVSGESLYSLGDVETWAHDNGLYDQEEQFPDARTRALVDDVLRARYGFGM